MEWTVDTATRELLRCGQLTPSRIREFRNGVSGFGLFDLGGNVADMDPSEYRPYPYRQDDGRENLNADTATRVIRGGSFYDGASLVRSKPARAADSAPRLRIRRVCVVLSSAASADWPD